MSDVVEVIEDVVNVSIDETHIEVVSVGTQGPPGPTGDPATNLVTSVAGGTGDVTLEDMGLDLVDNTSDLDKPVSTAQQNALNAKMDFPSSNARVPVRGASNNQASIPYAEGPTAGSFPLRTSDGQVRTSPATLTDAAVPKAQMDAADATKVGIANDETITGRKTFGLLPIFNSAPVSANHASNKGYVDSRIQQGTGFPNGVVAAPVGSIYIDTAATMGAISWVKASGTGNTGWVVEYGDTGWRNITSTTINGWGAVEIRLRRVNETVYWGFEALNASASTLMNALLAPSGFRFTGSTYVDRQFLTTATGPASVYRVTLSNTGVVAVQNWSTAIPLLYGALVSSTTEAWPTTLPGTAL